jgi:hypothetical protein
VNDARWRKYAEQAFVPPKLLVRKQVRRGDAVAYVIDCPWQRTAYRSKLLFPTTIEPVGDVIQTTKKLWEGFLAGGVTGVVQVDEQKLAAARDGAHTLTVTLAYRVTDTQYFDGPALAGGKMSVSGDWELAPAETQTVKLIHDPAARAAIEKSFVIPRFSLDRDDRCQIEIEATSLPYPMACDVIVRSGASEWRLPGVYFPAGHRRWGSGTYGSLKGLTADRVDIVLRASPAVARTTVDLTRIWDGEAIIKDVPVRRAGN